MSYRTDREWFLNRAGAAGIRAQAASQLLRAASTLQRLAVAQCNGDYPADNGERKTAVCSRCEGLWVPSVLLGKDKLCPDCRTTDRVKAILQSEAPGWLAEFAGDPRGYVLHIGNPVWAAASHEDRDSGRAELVPGAIRLAVPGRE